MIVNSVEIDDDDKSLPTGPSRLFLLRVWLPPEAGAGDQAAWPGRLQDPVTGQICKFCGWDGLRRAILQLMASQQSQGE